MKKLIALLIVLSMVVAMVPTFAVVSSAAAEEYTPAQNLTDELAKAEYTQITPPDNVSLTGGGGCGFLDGNFSNIVADNSTAEVKMGTDRNSSYIYVNGVLADFNPNHAGPQAGGNGWYFSIYDAKYTSGDNLDITIVYTDTLTYVSGTMTAPMNSNAYDDCSVIIAKGVATVIVTGDDIAALYNVGDTVTARLHDDHTERSLTVISNEGGTVTLEGKAFTGTSKTLFEVAPGTDRAFCAMVDTNDGTYGSTLSSTDENKFNAYMQTKPGSVSGNDMRFILTADIDYLNNGWETESAIFQNADLKITFKKGDATVKALTVPLNSTSFYSSVFADNDYFWAATDEVIFGTIITNIPTFAWSEITLEVINDNEQLCNLSTAKDIKEIVALGGYTWLEGETNISSSTGKNSGGESSIYLFDKTAAKYGYHSGGGDQTITWEYDAAKTISLYGFTAGNDTTYNTDRNPTGWIFYGSNDTAEEKTWNVLAEVSEPNMKTDGGHTTYYTVDNPAAYKYYKILFHVNNTYFQLGEIKMYETAAGATYNFNNTISGAQNFAVSNLGCWGDGPVSNFFDGDANTKVGGNVSGDKVTITWNYATAVTAAGYSLTSANDSTYYGRNPNNWTIYGSNDNGTTWIELDSVSVGGDFSGEIMFYGFDAPAAYQHYKIEFAKSGGFQMADIALYN